MKGDRAHMERALALAARARGRTSPNPMVGAVLVAGGDVVGEGFHERAGGDHAEIRALAAAGDAARCADLYVTLEPCAHHGRTPPCTAALLKAGVARVHAAMTDPNPLVAGRGFSVLREHGIPLSVGLMEDEARRLNEFYVTYMTRGRPFVILKCGVSLDGKTATRTRESRWITNKLARRRVHEMRDSVDAVMVGIGTVLADDPELTTRRNGGGGRNPHRIVVDGALRIPAAAKVLERRQGERVILAAGGGTPADRVAEMRSLGAEVLVMEESGRTVDMRRLMDRLGSLAITSLLVEGGSEIAAAVLEAGVVDKVVYFIAPKIIGGREAPSPVGGEGIAHIADALELRELNVETLGDNIMVEGYIHEGATPCSPD